MTADQMLTELAQRLEDANASEFSDTMKVDALNNAQNRMVDLLHGEYLTELEVREGFSHSANSPKMVFGVLDFNTLSNTVLHGAKGIKAIKVLNGKYMNKLDVSDVKEFDSAMVDTDLSDPYYIALGDKAELVPSTSQVHIPIDVYYIKTPTKMAVGGTCELNEGLHYLLIILAESYCWSNSEEFTRSQDAERIALEQIKIMNSNVAVQGE